MKQGSTLSYLHHDHLGSLVSATNASGAEVAWARYAPFGQLRALSGSGSLPSDRLFTGQTRDNVLGAGVAGNDAYYFFKARYYDATIGQFQSADTASASPAHPRGLNRYAYADNNPLRLRDSTGHAAEMPVEMLPAGPLVNLAAAQQHQPLVNIAPPIHVGPLVFTGRMGVAEPLITTEPSLNLSRFLPQDKLQGIDPFGIFSANSKKMRRDLGGSPHDRLQSHHAIPGELEKHQVVQRAIAAGWSIDSGERNGMLLPDNPQDAIEMGLPYHNGPHPKYTNRVREQLDDLQVQTEGQPDNAILEKLDHLSWKVQWRILHDVDPGSRVD